MRAGALVALLASTAPAAAIAQPPAQSLPRGAWAPIALSAMGTRGGPAVVLPPAEATAQCAPLGEALKLLQREYGEVLLWWGEAPGDVTMIVTERPDTRTWTLLVVHGGEACMVGAGGSAGAWGS